MRDHYPKIRDRIEADAVNTPDLYWKTGKDLSYRQLLLLDGVENVVVRGQGFIEGNGTAVRPQGSWVFNCKVINSRNVRFEDVAFVDSPSWNIHLLHSEHITIRWTKLIANPFTRNSDGINPDASKHILIEDNFYLCNDDFVAIKVTGNGGLYGNVEDVVVRRNSCTTDASAFKVGTEVRNDCTVSNVLFEDNDALETDRGMSLYVRDGGTVENIQFVNNRFERLWIEGLRRLIHFDIQHRGGLGRIRNVLIKDCIALAPWPLASTFTGLEADHRISDVRIENLVIGGRPVLGAADIPLETNELVDGVVVIGPGSNP